ncbi:coenzyme F420-0:L-glutamate ligase [Candidatus Thorarchaeota archaeon]|nr:MAG: coenzyme F420-0:L-glutamate ligase [Candidatus Thorarchaeota archaeon]
MNRIQVISVDGLPLIHDGDDISDLILKTLKKNNQKLQECDVLVLSHKIVSKSEGKIYRISKITPSLKAKKIAQKTGQSEMKIEVALQESIEVLREEPVLITKTKIGLITDYSGIDQSNAPEGTIVALPENPDASAETIHINISKAVGFSVPVIISDTQGRPWRRGAVNLAIGLAGMSPFTRNKGNLDLYNKELHSSLVCIADEIAAAAELVMGQADEKTPAAIVRGIQIKSDNGTARTIIRDQSENLFL